MNTVDLSQFVDKEVVITLRDGSKSMGTVQRSTCSIYPYWIDGHSYTQDGMWSLQLGCVYNIVHIKLAEEKKVKESLTDASINAFSEVIAKHLRDEVHDMVANKIRSEFNNGISETLVHKIALKAIKKL